MSKKLYVPDHVAEKAIKAGFRDNQPKSKTKMTLLKWKLLH